MQDKDKAEILVKQLERFHAEILERIRTFSALWRTLLLGVAGIVAFGGETDIKLVILIAPPLAAIVLAYMLSEQGSLVLVSRAMAAHEQKLNTIVGEELLTYETDRSKMRQALVTRRRFRVVIVLGSLLYGVAIWRVFPQTQITEGRDLRWGYSVLAGIAFVVVLACALRFLSASTKRFQGLRMW